MAQTQLDKHDARVFLIDKVRSGAVSMDDLTVARRTLKAFPAEAAAAGLGGAGDHDAQTLVTLSRV